MLRKEVIKLVRILYNRYIACRSRIRMFPLMLLGFKCEAGVIIGKKSKFPLFNLRNIKIKKGVHVGADSWFFLPAVNRNCTIGIDEGTHIGDRFTISCNNKINIGKNCLLSYNVSILDHDHMFEKNSHPTTSGLTKGHPISIGDDCFIGCGAVILKGVSLGNHCVVGSNAVVTRSFPDGSIIIGVPARVVSVLGNQSVEVK